MLTTAPCPIAPLSTEADNLLKRQILWVLFFRVMLVTVLLGLTVFLQSRGDYDSPLPSFLTLAVFIGFIYLFTIVSALIIGFVPCSKPFAYLQIGLDVLLTTLLVLFSGGSQSILLIFYFFPIASAAILLLKRGALFMAALAVFNYGTIIWLEYHGLFPRYLPNHNFEHINLALHRFSVAGLSLFLIAILSAILAERLQRAEMNLSVTTMDRDRLALLYRQIFADINTGIITVDSNGIITSCNTAASKITGFSTAQVLGSTFNDLLPSLTLQESTLRAMTEINRHDGSVIPVGYTWTQLHMPGETGISRLYTMQDLSQIRAMEEQVRQAEKMAAVGRMAAGIAHEFRNPLAAMSGAAQMLAEELATNPTTTALMNIIIRESDRLEGTISEFLLFSRPAKLEQHWFPLAKLCAESITMAQNDPAWHDAIHITTTIPAELDYYGDGNQLRQVIINLLINSCHAVATKKSGEIVIIGTENKRHGNDYITISVADNGCGIDEKIAEKIFDPFFTNRENGTGLGLAIVQQIVDSHQGSIKVDNNEWGGATFTISLPLPVTAINDTEK